MKKYIPHILISCFLLLVFLFQMRFIQQPVIDNDEGIYTATFLLINHGFPAYTQTFFSQPPGFLVSVYPFFVTFGRTLQAARIGIVFWSMLGLFAICCIGYDLGNIWIGILSLGLLNSIYYFSNQMHVFQSDALVSSFTLISLAALLRYKNTKKIIWYIFSVIFLNLLFWTKLHFLFIPSFLFIVFIMQRKKVFSLLGIFIAISGLFLLLFHMFFGIKNIFSAILNLRIAAFHSSTFSYQLLTYVTKNPLLLSSMLLTIVLLFFQKKRLCTFPIFPIFLWSILTFLFLFFYQPLFAHHMTMLVVPWVLLFSLLLIFTLKKWMIIYKMGSIGTLLVAIIFYFNQLASTPHYFLSSEQQTVAHIITQNTMQSDIVVTDEEILYQATNRLPLPFLTDTSYVRIASGNLSQGKFQKILDVQKPKLLIPWNGRLAVLLKNADLSKYTILTKVDNKTIYIHQ